MGAPQESLLLPPPLYWCFGDAGLDQYVVDGCRRAGLIVLAIPASDCCLCVVFLASGTTSDHFFGDWFVGVIFSAGVGTITRRGLCSGCRLLREENSG